MKKLLCVLLICLLPITAHGQTVLPRTWKCSLSALVAALTECQAVPTNAADRHILTDIIVQTTTATAGDYSIQTGTGTNCATGTAALFPSTGVNSRFKAPIAANPAAVISLRTFLAAPAGAAVCVIGTGTNTINIELIGIIAR